MAAKYKTAKAKQ